MTVKVERITPGSDRVGTDELAPGSLSSFKSRHSIGVDELITVRCDEGDRGGSVTSTYHASQHRGNVPEAHVEELLPGVSIERKLNLGSGVLGILRVTFVKGH